MCERLESMLVSACDCSVGARLLYTRFVCV